MDALLVLAVAPCATPAMATIPDLRCEVTAGVQLDPGSLEPTRWTDATIYQVRTGALWLAPTDGPDYEYGTLQPLEQNRYVVGDKTVVFDDSKGATPSHVSAVDVRVPQLTCVAAPVL